MNKWTAFAALCVRTVALVALSAGLALTGAASASSNASARWVATELETLGGLESYARAISLRGQIVGDADTRDEGHAVLWRSGKAIDLGTLGGRRSIATAISDRGEVGGWSTRDRGYEHAFVWRAGTMTDIAPPRTSRSDVIAINARGGVIGVAITRVARGPSREHAFYWRNGKWSDIGALFPLKSVATAINDRGQVIGGWRPHRSSWRGFVWRNGRSTDLGTLAGGNTYPRAINERGQVVGVSESARRGERFMHAFLWERGRMRDLGTLGGTFSTATDINDSGVVVGWSDARSGDLHAFRWRNGRMEDLGVELDYRFFDPLLIANSGLIAGDDSGKPFVIDNGRVVRLPRGSRYAVINAVSARGKIVGAAWPDSGSPAQGVLWQKRP